MNLNISNHFYTVYFSIRKALLQNDIIIFVQSLAEAMFLSLDWSGAEYSISFHFFDVFLCELLYDVSPHPFHADFCYFTGWLCTKPW